MTSRILHLIALVLFLTLAPAAAGQTAQQSKEEKSGETSAEAPLVVDEIFVEAQLRQESLQEVPFSITAFSDIQVEEAGIETPEDVLALTANITLGNSFTVGNSFVTVRGITQINNSDPSVAIVVDGVYQANQKQLNQELFDIERIEVLKGPQGSIYGRNSLGGVINIVTKEPNAAFSGFLQAGVGNGDTTHVAGSVGGALSSSKKVLGRLAASYKDSGGLIDNVFLEEKADLYEDVTLRGRLRFFPSRQIHVDVRGQTSSTDGGAVHYSLLPTDIGANAFDIRPDESFLGFSERDIDDYSLTFEWTGSKVLFTSISGYTDLQELYRGDLDFSNPERFPESFPLGQGQDLDVSFFSQEVRLSSIAGGPVQWHAGAYYLRTDRALQTVPYLDTDGTVDGFIPLFFIGEDNDNTAYAAFGQVDWALSDTWSLVAGLRYDEDKRHQTDVINGGDRSRSFQGTQPRLTVRRTWSPNLMAYLTLARGFRSGGFNAPTIRPDFFRKEVTDNLEVGFKSMLAGQRLRLNGAAYLTSVDDFQFFQVDVTTASQIISNIRDVEMTGFELELLAKVTRGVEVIAALGLNDASIEDFDGSGRFEGNQTPNNIKETGSLAIQYNAPLSEKLLLTLRGDVEYRGKQYWHADNLDVTDARTFAHARLGIEGGKWSFTLWGKNLFDEDFWAEYFDATWGGIPSGMDVGWPGRPRTLGADFKVRF